MIGIIGAMSPEIQGLIALLNEPKTEEISGITYYRGRIGRVDVVCAKSGVGKVFASVCAQTMVLRYKVNSIINTGIAGALDSSLKIGDLAISTQVCQHDMDTSAVGDPKGMVSGINKIYFGAAPKLICQAEKIAQLLGIRVAKGTIASGDQFICDQVKKDQIKELFNAIAVEMEGAAIGQVCFINKVPFVVLRVISDNANGDASINYSEFLKIASTISLKITSHILLAL